MHAEHTCDSSCSVLTAHARRARLATYVSQNKIQTKTRCRHQAIAFMRHLLRVSYKMSPTGDRVHATSAQGTCKQTGPTPGPVPPLHLPPATPPLSLTPHIPLATPSPASTTCCIACAFAHMKARRQPETICMHIRMATNGTMSSGTSYW